LNPIQPGAASGLNFILEKANACQ